MAIRLAYVLLALLLAPFPVIGETTSVRIGVIAPLSGPQAFYGEDAKKVVELLQGEFEREGGPYKFQIILEDGQCGLGSAAITAAQKLVSIDKVKFIVAGCSGEVLQVAPIVERAKVILMGYAASHPDISSAGDYVFRDYLDMKRGLVVFVDDFRRRITGSLALITEDSSFTMGIKKQLTETLGSRITYSEDYKVDESDFHALLLRAKASDAAAYYLNCGSPRTYTALYKQLRESGITAPVYSYYQPEDKDAIAILGKLQDGVRYLALPSVAGSGAFAKFRAQFAQRFPGGPRMPLLMATSYDSINVLRESILAVGPDTEKVKAYLYEHEFEGAVGRIKFDHNGDLEDLNLVLKEIRGGQPSELGGEGQPAPMPDATH